MKLYTQYVNNYDDALGTLSRLQQNKKFSAFLQVSSSSHTCDRLSCSVCSCLHFHFEFNVIYIAVSQDTHRKDEGGLVLGSPAHSAWFLSPSSIYHNPHVYQRALSNLLVYLVLQYNEFQDMRCC